MDTAVQKSREGDKRIGVVGIVLEDPKTSSPKVNAVIGDANRIVMGRMGLPGHGESASVIALIVQGSTDEIGALTGKLGSIGGVSVKSALTSEKK